MAGGVNNYQYAPNPVGWIDPLGLNKKSGCDCENISNDIVNRERAGSANKTDPMHKFNDIVDNYAGDASKFEIPTKGPGGTVVRTSELSQIEGSLNGKEGVFEWVVDQGKVTHRRFIPGGKLQDTPIKCQGNEVMSVLDILQEKNLLSWSVLLFGLERGWVDVEQVIEYALNYLSMHPFEYHEDISILAGAAKDNREEILGILSKLAGDFSFERVKDIWRLAFLSELYFSHLGDEEKIYKLQEVYADFDYPQDMEGCSIYSNVSIDPLIALKKVIDDLLDKLG